MSINRFLAVVLLVFLITGCSSAGKEVIDVIEVITGNQCDFLPDSAQPAWVAGESEIAGFYTGVGESDAREGKDQAISKARQNAIAAISSSIQTTISQKVVITMTDSSAKDLSHQQMESFSRSVSENSIRNVTRDSLWLDRDGCRLWMRVKVAEADVQRVQDEQASRARLLRANKLYDKARDYKLLFSDRIEAIEDGIRVLSRIDFSHLVHEDRDFYLKKFRALQLDLIGQIGQQTVLIITLSQEDIPRTVHKEIAFRLSRGVKNSRHLFPAPCTDMQACLHYARKMHAQSLLLAEIRSSLSNSDMGSYLGRIEMDTEMYDVATSRQLGQVQNQNGEVLSFDRNSIRWEQAVERLFSDNQLMAHFIQTAVRCSKEAC